MTSIAPTTTPTTAHTPAEDTQNQENKVNKAGPEYTPTKEEQAILDKIDSIGKFTK